MADSAQSYNRKLSDEAKRLENAGQFAEAAALYKQVYNSYPGSFVTSHYIKCLRRQGKPMEAIEFGRQLSAQLQDDPYVHKELLWTMYDAYLKQAGSRRDDEFDAVKQERQSVTNGSLDFQKMQEVAHYILRKAPAEEDLLRTRTIFAICNEAKRQESWQVMYDFAMQLDLERLLSEPSQMDGQRRIISYQAWLSKVIESLFELKRYDECMDFAQRGIESYPHKQIFYEWHERANKALEQVPVTIGQKREPGDGKGDIRLIHFADIHLGFTGPTNLVLGNAENAGAAGRYMREVDIEETVKRMMEDVIHAQPAVDMVVIAGDLFHKSVPYPRAISFAAKMIRLLMNHDIPVVIIDGNHETASILLMGSPTTFLRELNAHVINGSSYEVLHDCWSCRSSERQARISKLAVHALPYRALRGNPDFSGLHPISGYINVLLTHGRVSGMNELNSLHHTAYTIPSDILLRGWDYVAMGDWHIHRYQPLKNVSAFYAGSLEALNFGEAVAYPLRPNDTYAVHGALDVRLHVGEPADVRSLANRDARPVLRLEPIDAIHENAKTLMDILHVRLQNGLPAHAIVLLEVNNILPQVWGQLDHATIAKLRKLVRRCEIRWNFQRTTPSRSSEAMSGAALDRQWEHFLEQREKNTTERTWYKDEGMKRIEEARRILQVTYAQEGE